MKSIATFILALMISVMPVYAGQADVVQVQVSTSGERTYDFHVTVKHRDTGWDHYADRWEILAADGKMLGTRKLLHPHVNEQPFTRSLSGVRIPNNIKQVSIRAHDSVHGYGGRTVTLELP